MSSMYSNMVHTEHQQRQDAGRGNVLGNRVHTPSMGLSFCQKKIYRASKERREEKKKDKEEEDIGGQNISD